MFIAVLHLSPLAPYVDERIFRRTPDTHPNGYIELGQEWHSKMVLRAELTGVPINGYNTGLDDARKPISALEVDYWFAGLVATGTAPQPEGGGDARPL